MGESGYQELSRYCLEGPPSRSGRDNPISHWPDSLMVARRRLRNVKGMTAPNLRGEPSTGVHSAKPFGPGGPGQSAASPSFPAAAKPPRQLLASFWLWLLAVAAGLFETTLVVFDATAGEVGSAAEMAVGVTLRLLAFTGLVYLAARLRQGWNWARIALAVLCGGFGALSLIIGPVTWLAAGGSLASAMAAADFGSVLFAASRLVHLGAIVAALILMFQPAANAYIRATRRIHADRNRA
jgi:hypothetical protein